MTGNRAYWHPNAFYAWLDRRLSANGANADAEHDCATEPQPARAKPKARSQPATANTEVHKVRNRTQAQLEALLT